MFFHCGNLLGEGSLVALSLTRVFLVTQVLLLPAILLLLLLRPQPVRFNNLSHEAASLWVGGLVLLAALGLPVTIAVYCRRTQGLIHIFFFFNSVKSQAEKKEKI